MTRSDYKISVGLYIRGYELDPAVVSRELHKNPDRSQYRGERALGAGGRQYVRNIGLWALEANPETESTNLRDYISDLLLKINFDYQILSRLKGVEEAYVDIFIARESDEEGSVTCDFEIDKDQMRDLSRIGVPVRFTIAVVKP